MHFDLTSEAQPNYSKTYFMNIFRCFDENQMCNNPHGFSCLPQKNDYNTVYKNVNVKI